MPATRRPDARPVQTPEPLAGLAAFVAVVETQSFTAAAQRLGTTKSRVSKQVTRLEDRLGVRLLHRTTRRLSLTEAGERLHERAARSLAELAEAQQEVSAFQDLPHGVLRVSAPMSFGLLHVAPALPEFMRRYPKVVIDLQMDDRKVDVVSEGFDVVIRIGRLADSSLVARRIAPVRMYTAAAPDYLRAHGTPQHPLDLRVHHCLVYTGTQLDWQYQDADGREFRVDVNGVYYTNNGQALRDAALAGIGILRSPDFSIGADIAAGRLVALLEDYRTFEPDIYIVLPERKHMPPKVRAFVEFMSERLVR
ncbi:MAG: LysR family transcriptional regulator [Pseudomonadota bacterium]